MPCLKTLRAALALSALPLAATGQQPGTPSEIVDKVVMQEQAEIQLLRQYSPLVETYIQYLRLDKQLRVVPDGDKYFLGRAKLAKGRVAQVPPFGTWVLGWNFLPISPHWSALSQLDGFPTCDNLIRGLGAT